MIYKNLYQPIYILGLHVETFLILGGIGSLLYIFRDQLPSLCLGIGVISLTVLVIYVLLGKHKAKNEVSFLKYSRQSKAYHLGDSNHVL